MEQIWDDPFVTLREELKTRYMFVHSAIEKDFLLPDGTMKFTEVLVEKDLFTLLSWINAKDIAAIKSLQQTNPEYKGRVIIDSGAYSVWNSGKDFDTDKYIDWLNSDDIIDMILWAAEADVIPGERGRVATPEEANEAAGKSWENYLYMTTKVKWPKKIVPIYHQGEDLKFLKQMLEYTFEDGSHIPYIGISPLIASPNILKNWYQEVNTVIKNSSNPDVLTHNFGMTSFRIMENFKSCSSDSSVCTQNAIRAKLLVDVVDGIPKFVNVGKRSFNYPEHYTKLSSDALNHIKNTINKLPHNITWEEVIKRSEETTDTSLLLYCNICAVENWAKEFKYKNGVFGKNVLW